MKRWLCAWSMAVLVCAGAPSNPKKVSADAARKSSADSVQVVIQWALPVGALTQELISSLTGNVVAEFPNVRQGVYQVPGSALARLGQNSLVKYVSLDRPVHQKLAYSAAAVNAPSAWASGYTGAGIGVAVLDSGINPDPNLGVKNPIAFTWDFTAAPSLTTVIKAKPSSWGADWYGHGQHVAGIIASNGNASLCKNCTMAMVGIAPGATLINLKVLDEFGEGSDSNVISAIDAAITLKSVYNIRVMNLSLGRPVYESYTQDPLCQAVEAAWKAGIAVVVAAGNDGRDYSLGTQGYGTITSPGNDPYVITVGAMKTEKTFDRTDDLVASYSSKGPTMIDHVVKPDIMAPGNQVVSLLASNGTLPLTYPQNAVPLSTYQSNAPQPPANAPAMPPVPSDPTQQPPKVNFGPGMSQNYYTLSGTSMAAPVVSGALADIFQAYPNLTPDQAKTLIMMTAYKSFPVSSSVVDPVSGTVYIDYYDIFTIGAGYLDIQAALANATQVPAGGNALSPIAVQDPNSGNVTLQYDSASVWANQSVWGARSIWGAAAVWSLSVLSGNNAVGGERCLWGATSNPSSGDLWSERCLWGASTGTAPDTGEAAIIAGEN